MKFPAIGQSDIDHALF
jgi:hypothetical protein